MAQLRRLQGEFESRGVRVIAIHSAEGTAGQSVCEMLEVPYLCLGDPSGKAYEAYGLGRGGVSRMFNFHTMFRGTLAFLKGHRQGTVIGDRFRLPGAFVIDRGGVIRWLSQGKDAADHPSAFDLLSAIDRLGIV